MLPGLSRLDLQQRRAAATGVDVGVLNAHKGVILDLINSERGPPGHVPNSVWLANKREQQAAAIGRLMSDLFKDGEPPDSMALEAFHNLYGDVRNRGKGGAISTVMRTSGTLGRVVGLLHRAQASPVRQQALGLLASITGATEDWTDRPMVNKLCNTLHLARYLVELLLDFPGSSGSLWEPQDNFQVEQQVVQLLIQLIDPKGMTNPGSEQEPMLGFATQFCDAGGVTTLLSRPCFNPIRNDGYFSNEQGIFTALHGLAQMGDAILSKMIEAGTVGHLFRLALDDGGKDDYYPRRRALDIVNVMLTAGAGAPAVADAVRPHMSKLIAFFKRASRVSLDTVSAVGVMEAATSHESLLKIIVETDGCLQTINEHFQSIDTRAQADLGSLIHFLLVKQPALRAQFADAYDYLSDQMKSSTSWQQNDAFLRPLATFWEQDPELVEQFMADAPRSKMSNLVASLALRASDPEFSRALTHIVSQPRAWQELERLVDDVEDPRLDRSYWDDDSSKYTWDRELVAKVLRDKRVLLKVATIHPRPGPEPLAAYMLLSQWQHEAASSEAFDARWWYDAAIKLGQMFEDSLLHGPLIKQAIEQLIEYLLAPGGPLYKTAKESYEENDAKRMRTRSAFRGGLRELSGAVVSPVRA